MPDSKSQGPKGLDEFARKFLIGSADVDSEEDGAEYIVATPGGKVDDKAMAAYLDLRKEEFIKSAGSFTEDLLAFFVEQKKLRNLSDKEAVFALALANINLRHHYVHTDVEGQTRRELEEEFDGICWGAQQYWDSNQE